MLDESTPTDTNTSDGGPAGSAPDDAGTSAPPRRRRATKKAGQAASSTAPPALTEPTARTESTAPTASTEAAGSAPAKKAARKATAKRAAKKTAGAAASTDQESTDQESTARDTGAAESAEPTTKKSAKKASRQSAAKKSAKKTAGASASSGSTDSSADSSSEASSDSAASSGGSQTPVGGMVLFQAPEPVVAPRRSRARKAAASSTEGDEHSDRGTEHGDRDDQSPASGPEDEPGDGSTEGSGEGQRKRRRRGGRGRRGRSDADGSTEDGTEPAESEGSSRSSGGRSSARSESTADNDPDEESAGSDDEEGAGESSSSRRRRRRRRSGQGESAPGPDDPPNTVVRVRERRPRNDEITGVRGSTRLEAKKQRRREGREQGRRKQVITEAEFLARRESVERVMVVRQTGGRTQIGVLEDDVLVEHYVSRDASASMAGNVYLGRVQNVLPSMEAAFVDIGKGRNAVLYAGEVNWDAAGVSGQAKRIENVLKSGESVLVQVTKDPMGHKGARLTSQISLPGRYLVYVPQGSMTGISRKLPENERTRLKQILKAVLPEGAGVIVRTAAEGASEDELRRDVERLTHQWEEIQAGASGSATAPALLHGEPDLTVRVIRDVFNEDFAGLVVSGTEAWQTTSSYVAQVAPDLSERVSQWTAEEDVFSHYRIDEQLAKALDRKVWLPSGGSLVIDRTEAMTVVDVNTGKFTGSGGNLEETVTKNNIEAAEEIVRQLRLRDVGGIIVIDFIDMVLESNRELVLRRLLECLGRDRTKHQVAEVTSLGLVQMTRKRVGQGLLEVFSETCEVCHGRGVLVHTEPIEKKSPSEPTNGSGSSKGRRGGRAAAAEPAPVRSGPTAAEIAARAHAAAVHNAKLEAEAGDGDSTDSGESTEPADADLAPEQVEDAAQAAAEQPGAIEVDGVVDDETDEVVQEAVEQEAVEQEAIERPAAEQPDAHEPEPEQEQDPTITPPAPRRRRGRVTAPAGPPRPHTE